MANAYVADNQGSCLLCNGGRNSQFKLFPCKHYACTSCADSLEQSADTTEHFFCPICQCDVAVPPEGLPTFGDFTKLSIHLEHEYPDPDCPATERLLIPVKSAEESSASGRSAQKCLAPNWSASAYTFLMTHHPEQESEYIVPESQAQPPKLFIANEVQLEEAHIDRQPEVSHPEEQQQSHEVVELYEAVDTDRRCDVTCHPACITCTSELGRNCHEAFCNIKNEKTRPMTALLLPCWIFCLLKTAKPCCGVFSKEGEIKGEQEEIAEMREVARNAFLDKQLPLFPFWFRFLWALVMLVVMAAGIVWPRLLQLEVKEQDLFATDIAFMSLTGLFFIMWLTLVVLNFAKFRPIENHPIRRDQALVSYFAMEQLQMYLSELSLCPQLCLAAIKFSIEDSTNIAVHLALFLIPLCLLLVIFVLRALACVRLKEFSKIFYARLLFSIISNYFSVLLLLAIALMTSPDKDLTLQLMLSGMILLTTFWNQIVFYLSHLYEISLQSAVNAVKLDACDSRHAARVLQKLQSLPVFHKNMYTMSMPGFGTLLYFWIVPSTVILCYVRLTNSSDEVTRILVVVWYFFNAAINYKSLLMSCSAHFTAFTIGFLVTATIFMSMFFVSVIYGGILAVLAVICCCTVMKTAASSTTTGRVVYVD